MFVIFDLIPVHYRLVYLVDIWVFLRIGEHVESRVELVEHPDNFHGAFRVRVTRTIVTESDYAGKQQCHALEPFRRNRSLMPQFCRHADWQHGIQQSKTIRSITEDEKPFYT